MPAYPTIRPAEGPARFPVEGGFSIIDMPFVHHSEQPIEVLQVPIDGNCDQQLETLRPQRSNTARVFDIYDSSSLHLRSKELLMPYLLAKYPELKNRD